MTGWHMKAGYSSEFSKADVWAALKAVVKTICARPEDIAHEAFRVEPNWNVPMLLHYAEPYRHREDLTLTVHEPVGDVEGSIDQLASGAGEGRAIKEAVRRAFVRLVIQDMHKQRMDVTLVVA